MCIIKESEKFRVLSGIRDALVKLEKIKKAVEDGKAREFFDEILNVEEKITFLANDLILKGEIKRI